jgi:hypothetical protein
MHKNIIQHIRKHINLSDSEAAILDQYVETLQLKKRIYTARKKVFISHQGYGYNCGQSKTNVIVIT